MQVNMTVEQAIEVSRGQLSRETVEALYRQWTAAGLLTSKRVNYELGRSKTPCKAIELTPYWLITPLIVNNYDKSRHSSVFSKYKKCLTHKASGLMAVENRGAKEIILWYLGLNVEHRYGMEDDDTASFWYVEGLIDEFREFTNGQTLRV